MANMLDLFFSQSIVSDSMQWSFFLNQIGSLMRADAPFFNDIMIKYIRKRFDGDKNLSFSNFDELLKMVNEYFLKYLRELLDPNSSSHLNTLNLIYYSTRFIRSIIQITTYVVNGSTNASLITSENQHIYAKFLQCSSWFLIKTGFRHEECKITDEIIIIFNIICYSICDKSLIRSEFDKILTKSEIIVSGLFYKLLYIIISNPEMAAKNWSTSLVDRTKTFTRIFSFGLLDFGSRGPKPTTLVLHACLFFNHLIYSDQKKTTIFSKYLSAINFSEIVTYHYFKFTKNEDIVESDHEILNDLNKHKIKFCIDDLFYSLTNYLEYDIYALMVYLFVKNNPSFVSLIIHSKFIDAFIIKIVKQIYNVEKLSHYKSCLLLIILLLLTSEPKLVCYLHVKNANDIGWMNEESRCSDWNVTNVILVCLLRGLRYNHFSTKDEFSQDNYVSTLLNMCSGQIQLNNEAAFQMINLLKLCATQYLTLFNDESTQNASTKTASFKIIGNILTFINLILSNNISTNPYLIHHLLLMKQGENFIDKLQETSSFPEEIANIMIVINFYSFKFSQMNDYDGTVNPTRVIENIKNFTRSSSIIISFSKEHVVYDFQEGATSNIFFVGYLKLLFENENLFNLL